MNKFVWIYIFLGVAICMTGCGESKSTSKEDTQGNEIIDTTSPSDNQIGSVHLENYTGVIVGVEGIEDDEVDQILGNEKLQIACSDGDEVIVCELLGNDTKYPNADILKIGDQVELECEVSVVDGAIMSRSVLSIKVIQEEEM